MPSTKGKPFSRTADEVNALFVIEKMKDLTPRTARGVTNLTEELQQALLQAAKDYVTTFRPDAEIEQEL